MKTISIISYIPFSLMIVYLVGCGTSKTAETTREGAETGAVLGLLAGVAFGSGNIVNDAVSGTITGAAIGTGVGYVAGKIEEGNATEEDLDMAFGKDNVQSYYALRSCEHKRAYLLAEAGETSQDANHRITAMWMQAIIAVDNRDRERANKEFERLIIFDPDIDTKEQARMETDRIVLELRKERRELKMPGCSES